MEIFVVLVCLAFAYVLGQTKLRTDRILQRLDQYDEVLGACDHAMFIDTQVKIVFCPKCRKGWWYEVKPFESLKVEVNAQD